MNRREALRLMRGALPAMGAIAVGVSLSPPVEPFKEGEILTAARLNDAFSYLTDTDKWYLERAAPLSEWRWIYGRAVK